MCDGKQLVSANMMEGHDPDIMQASVHKYFPCPVCCYHG